MATRRMRIDDYELMGHARRRYLSHLQELGSEITDEQRRHQEVLTQDTRLEGPLFMDWDIEATFDGVLIVALKRLLDTVEDDLADRGIPPEELPIYIEGRENAIREMLERFTDS